LPDLGLLGFGVRDLSFEVLGFEAFSFDSFVAGIALVRRGGARFAAFRTRLAMFPLVEA
jgi:hypothetical protein